MNCPGAGPQLRPLEVRRVADMSDDHQQVRVVEGAWVRIEAWLERYAPRSYRMLAPPAAEADIRGVEQDLDLTVPAGLRAFYLLHDGTGHPADFGWTPAPETGLAPHGQGTAWLLPRKHGIPPVQHLPYWDEGPHTIGRPDDPMVRYLAFAATDRSGLYGLFTDCTPGPGYGRIGTYEEAGIPKLGVWPSFADTSSKSPMPCMRTEAWSTRTDTRTRRCPVSWMRHWCGTARRIRETRTGHASHSTVAAGRNTAGCAGHRLGQRWPSTRTGADGLRSADCSGPCGHSGQVCAARAMRGPAGRCR